jgi:hypothetical protein
MNNENPENRFNAKAAQEILMSALNAVTGIGRNKPIKRNPTTKLMPTIVAVPTA